MFQVGLSLAPAPAGSGLGESEQPESYSEAQSDRDTLWQAIGRIRRLMARGEYLSAWADTEVELATFGELPVLLWLAARIQTERGMLEQAEPFWARLAELEPDNYELLTAWGGILLRQGNREDAETALLRANAIQPYFPHTLFHLIGLYVATDRAEQAGNLIRQLNAPDLALMARWMDEDYDILVTALGASAYSHVGSLLFSGGEPIESVRAPRVPDGALAFSPSGEQVGTLFGAQEQDWAEVAPEDMRSRLVWLSGFLQRYGELIQGEQWDNAARVGRRAEIGDRGFSAPVFRAFAAYAAYRSGRENGLADLHDLARQHPEQLHAGLRLTTALLEEGRFEDAQQYLGSLDATHPRHPLIKGLLACAYAGSGDHETALAVLHGVEQSGRAFLVRWFAEPVSYQTTIAEDPVYDTWRAGLTAQPASEAE